IDQVYAEIQKTIANMGSVPNTVLLQNNANKILNTIMNSKPQVLDNRMLEQGMYADVQFFVDELKKSKYDESNVEKMKSMTKEMEDRSKQMAVLQTLDSLWSLPLTFEATIKEQNKALDEQLTMQLLQDNFIKLGSAYVRSAVDKLGNPTYQMLPSYADFVYIKPDKLPTVKDSNGKEWDLTDYQSLQGKDAPASAELTMMVRLARNQMQTDFKQTFDPEKSENREVGVTMLDPKAMARVAQAAQSALGQLATDPQKMFEFNSADEKGKEAMVEAAKNSGYLVGPTVGGAFGTHHFNQYYPILKMKEMYNEIKAEGESVQGDPFVKSAKSLGGPMAASYVAKNLDTLKAVDSVLSSIPIVDRMNPLAMIKSFANGGILGVVTNVASVITETVSQVFTLSAAKVSVDYSYDNGFGASVDIGFGVGGARVSVINASYSEHGGFAASIGATIGKGTGFEAGAALTYSDKEGFGATASIKTAGFSAGIAYTQNSGFSASASVMLGDKSKGLQLGLNYNEKDGFSGKVGAAIDGYTGGINYSKADGVGVYAGRMLDKTTSAEVGWNRNKGFQASVGSDNARATYSEKDGLGFKFTKDVFDGEAEFAYTARGGFEASYSKKLGNGFTGSVSYSQKDGFSANVSHKDANNISRSLSIGRDGVSGSVQQNNTDDLFIDSLEELQGMNDQTIGVNKAKIEADSFKDFADGLSKNNPELAELKNDPAAFNAKVKELSEAGKLVDSQGKKYQVDQGASRDSFIAKAWGEVEDIGRSFVGQTVTDMGYVDSSGKFVVRTCFVAGTKVHTKEGLKNIEDIRVGDVVLSKSDETGEVSYRKVVNTFIRQTEAVYTVSFADGTVLETTWNHPFRVKKQGHVLEKFSIENTTWVQAKDLHPGDVALGADGKELSITDITIDEREETVYNFEVDEYHTYFVGEVGVWVHNQAYSEKSPLRKDMGDKTIVAGRVFKKSNGAGERYECIEKCLPTSVKESVVFQSDGTVLQRLEKEDGSFVNAIYDKNGKYLGSEANDATSAKNMVILNFKEVKSGEKITGFKTDLNGVTFNLESVQSGSTKLESIAATNSENKGIGGQIFLSIAGAAKKVKVNEINVNSLNYGLNPNDDHCGSHCSGRAMDIKSIKSKNGEIAYFNRRDYSDAEQNRVLGNAFEDAFYQGEIDGNRNKGIMVWTPDRMRGGSAFPDDSWSINPMMDSNYSNSKKLSTVEVWRLTEGKRHNNHGHFSAGI
ncbi:hypothetical protein EHQ23_07325, partial [Leptospira bourretii]